MSQKNGIQSTMSRSQSHIVGEYTKFHSRHLLRLNSVCGSDVHTISGGWGPPHHLPLIVGYVTPIPTRMYAFLLTLVTSHEIAGKVLRVGSKVTDVKPGDRAGVGAQIFSCLKHDCRFCTTDNENYCPHQVDTYNAEYPDGIKTMGGYSTAITANTRFVFPIPDEIESKDVCSMFCAGLTVYSPLVRNGITLAEGKGKKVGVVGLGGLGHYAVLFAKALGAEVYVFSHSNSKEEDARKMGADHFVVTSDVSPSTSPHIHASNSLPPFS